MTTKIFAPDDVEVRKFRERIFSEDLKLDSSVLSDINHENKEQYDTYAYWYCDQKFLNNGFDQVLIYEWEGEPVGICGGTHFNKNLYRGNQLYYILKKFRGKCNVLSGRTGGFMQTGVERAKELGCKGYFVSIHTYDRRHLRYWEGVKNDTVMAGIVPIKDRQFSAKDYVFLEKEYPIMNVKQKIMFHDIYNAGLDFDELFYERT